MRGAAIGVVLVAGLVVRTLPAVAGEYDACINAAGAINPKMRDCQDQELGRQDRALNTIYAAVIAKMKPEPGTAAKLRDAERAWITFRDADCAVLDCGVRDGLMDRMMLTDCIIDATKRRVIGPKSLEQRFGVDDR